MLTREGFVVAHMSGQGNFQRSSWKAEAIRRGNLKISGPIPITEDMPLNEDEEKEFAETGTLSPVLPHLEQEQDSQRPHTPSQVLQSSTSPLTRPMSLTSHPVEGQDHQQEESHERQPSRSPPRASQLEVSGLTRGSVAPPTSTASPTPFRSTPESASKVAQRKKRKSGLRNVFRKMFGRKSRADEEEEDPGRRGHSYHLSDPGMLRSTPPRDTNVTAGPQISDHPVEELPTHPLQQLPFPMNVNAPQSTLPSEYLHFERLGHTRRRATLPSVPSSALERHSLEEPREKLSPWGEHQDEDATSSPGIGIAFSGPPQEMTSATQRRRSRSADALRDLVKDHSPTERRRSAEIRYWRQSYASGGYSRPQTAKTAETVRSVHQQEPMITELETDAMEMSATLVHVDEPSLLPVEQGVPELDPEVQPLVSTFNFGLKSGFSDDTNLSDSQALVTPPAMPEMVPEPTQPRNMRMPIEERVAHIEGNIQSLELSMRRMSSRTNRNTIILSEAPRKLRSRNRDSSSQSTVSDHTPAHRSSNDTLNPGPASPTLVRPIPGESSSANGDKVLDKMYEALKYERSARKALQQQVQSLQNDVSDLHMLVNKLIVSAAATSPSYPTPSPDGVIPSTEERMMTPRADQPSKATRNEIRESVISKFSRSDSSVSQSGEFAKDSEPNWKNGSGDNVATPDIWATPKEEGFSGSGFFPAGSERHVRQKSVSDLRGC